MPRNKDPSQAAGSGHPRNADHPGDAGRGEDGGGGGGGHQNLALAAMLFAVAMTLIDQTIVAIAAPDITRELGLSSAGMRWVVNAYLLTLAAAFALAGRLADIHGRRRVVLIGTVVFVTASALCGAVPSGDGALAWLVTFRAVQGVGAALLFPAALAVVVAVFPVERRGRALALFFGLSGALTAVGPVLGSWLTEWTWRAIFWVNVPVAVVAVVLTLAARIPLDRRPARLDRIGALLVALGMGLSVLGLQQAAAWGWSSTATWGCIVGGLLLLALFARWEWRARVPLVRIRIFTDRAFAVDMAVLFFSMLAFVPVFFFASVYSQVALGYTTGQAAVYLLVFFAGFAIAAQLGGRVLDRRGARPTLILGGLLGTVGFALWATTLTDLSLSGQWHGIALAGAGIGLILGPASTDAVNRAIDASYGEVTGVSQTVRNYASSVGMAVLGTVLAHASVDRFTTTFRARGLPPAEAESAARSASASIAGHGQQNTPAGDSREEEFIRSVMGAVRADFAEANRAVFLLMAAALAIAFLLALLHPGGRVTAAGAADGDAGAGAGAGSGAAADTEGRVGSGGDRAGHGPGHRRGGTAGGPDSR